MNLRKLLFNEPNDLAALKNKNKQYLREKNEGKKLLKFEEQNLKSSMTLIKICVP